jgi:hypothetical protein
MHRDAPSSPPFFNLETARTANGTQAATEPILSHKWLEDILKEPCWRYQLLGKIMEFVVAYFQSVEPLGMHYLIQTKVPIDQAQWTVFGNIYQRLTLAPVRIVPQPETDTLVILLHQ